MNRLNGNGQDVQDLLLGLKEEADRLFTEGHLFPALKYYTHALRTWSWHIPNTPYNGGIIYTAENNVIMSILKDTTSNAVQVVTLLLEQSRDAWGRLPMDSYSLIDATSLMCIRLFYWVGISPQQRQKAHHYHAQFLEYLAEYLRNPPFNHHIHIRKHHITSGTKMPLFDSDMHFQRATEQYFYAWHADPTSETAQYIENQYQIMCIRHNIYINGETPPMGIFQPIPNYPDGRWEGDPMIIGDYDEGELRFHFAESVAREIRTMTVEELEGVKQKWGISGDKTDGLMRLLR